MKTRDQIEPCLKWNLEDIYRDEALWEADYQSMQRRIDAFSAHSGRLHGSADALFTALSDESQMGRLIEKLYSYAHLRKDEDNGNTRY